MVAEGSFLSSQDHAIGQYSEPAECGSDIHTHLFKIRLYIIFPSVPVFLTFRVFDVSG
jgi:hypothetical protein